MSFVFWVWQSTFVQHTSSEYPRISGNPFSKKFYTCSNVDMILCLEKVQRATMGDTPAITDLQTKVTRGRLSQIRIKDHKEQICHCSRCAGHVGIFSMVRPSQQQDAVLRFSFASWQVLHASVEPWVVALEGSQRWQYLLSSAPVPRYCMLGILSGASPSQRTAQQTHKIAEAATLIKQLRKRPYREAWGTCKEPWGFAGSLGCLQRRSYAPTNLMYFVHVPIPQKAVTRSPQKPCR